MATLAELLKTTDSALSVQAQKVSQEKEKQDKALSVKTDRSGRSGKTVTLISGFDHNPQMVEKIAKELKQACGAGGTVKGKIIEIQGDKVQKVKELLSAKGFAIRA